MIARFDHVVLSAVHTVLPSQCIALSDYRSLFGDEVDKIMKTTGLESIGLFGEETNAEVEGIRAAQRLLETEAMNAKAIDAVVFVSQTPSRRYPYGATAIQSALEMSTRTLCFDFPNGCAGYIQGLFQAALLIQSGLCRRVLVIAAECGSRLVDPNDRSLRMLFGDAATASLVEFKETESMTFALWNDGSGIPALHQNISSGAKEYMHMDGMEIFQFSITQVPACLENICNSVRIPLQQIPLFAMHQPNAFIINYLRKKLGLTEQQMPVGFNGIGNTGPASIPCLLSSLYGEDASTLTQAILCGFGIGLSVAACYLSLQNTSIAPVYYGTH